MKNSLSPFCLLRIDVQQQLWANKKHLFVNESEPPRRESVVLQSEEPVVLGDALERKRRKL